MRGHPNRPNAIRPKAIRPKAIGAKEKMHKAIETMLLGEVNASNIAGDSLLGLGLGIV